MSFSSTKCVFLLSTAMVTYLNQEQSPCPRHCHCALGRVGSCEWVFSQGPLLVKQTSTGLLRNVSVHFALRSVHSIYVVMPLLSVLALVSNTYENLLGNGYYINGSVSTSA